MIGPELVIAVSHVVSIASQAIFLDDFCESVLNWVDEYASDTFDDSVFDQSLCVTLRFKKDSWCLVFSC